MSAYAAATQKGFGLIRSAKALAANRGNIGDAERMAAGQYGEGSAPATILRAAVGPGTTTDPAWAHPLYQAESVDLLAVVAQASILGRMPNVRRLPLKTAFRVAVSGLTGAWVTEARSIPVSAMSLAAADFAPLQVGALVVASDELMRSASPLADTIFRNDLTRALAFVIDTALVDPLNLGLAGVRPASITSTVAATPAGSDPEADAATLIAGFGGDLATAVFIGGAARFGAMSSSASLDIGVRGGSIRGVPAIASTAATNLLVLLDAAALALVEDVIRIIPATAASVEMNDTPIAGETEEVSLWQNNLAGLMAVQGINWTLARPNSVSFVDYGA
ncbi:MAG: hypothetical protein ACRYG4_09215 [Janthinobacterium lividum]